GIGVVPFLGPFVFASTVAYLLLDWSTRASLITGTALSTTSLAVVYAVLVERGLTDTSVGKLLMSATFVTDLCTALALSAIFIKPNLWFPVFLAISVLLILILPRLAPWFFGRYGDRVIEPEIKLVFLCLLVLIVLADASNGHAVLPAFVLGLVMSRHYQEHREEQKRMRVVAFAFLTPFFFIKGGMNVSLGALVPAPSRTRAANRPAARVRRERGIRLVPKYDVGMATTGSLLSVDDVHRARERIGDRLHRTPLVRSATLSDRIGADVHFKGELFQRTGSFKPRGVLSKLATLTEEEKQRGLISISAGNHAQALAYPSAV